MRNASLRTPSLSAYASSHFCEVSSVTISTCPFELVIRMLSNRKLDANHSRLTAASTSESHAITAPAAEGDERGESATELSRLEDDLDLDGRVARQGVHADGGAGVLAGVAEQLLQELAGGVGDLGLIGEARLAVHERADA